MRVMFFRGMHMRNYTFGTLLAVFSLQCNNIGFVDKAKAVANNEFGVVVFYTNTTGQGDFFTDITEFSGLCSTITGLARANCICASEASSQGFAGTYRAWLSTSSVDAICNIQGNESSGCSVNSSLGPFLAKNGNSYTVLAENYAELVGTGFRTPVSSVSQSVYTGTNIDGRASGANCTDFTIANTTIPTTGNISVTGSGFTSTSTGINCIGPAALLCMKQSK
ncbi:MAG: hypothetical protein JNJ69_00415 [Leptospiraceae bacterium]|nr:hypothetical protein [Leptospiraceae bacterium]